MKPVLFIDFDGTLCHDRFWRSLPQEDFAKVQELLFKDDTTLLEEWMLGKRTAEEVNRFLAEQMGMPYEKLWELFVRDAETMRVPQGALAQIAALRDRYTIVLITVNMDSFDRFTVPALELDAYFDSISNSYHEGLFKNDSGGEVFRKYLEMYQAPVEHSFLIDDSTAACATFTALGGTAYQVTPEKGVTHHLAQISG